MSRRGESLLTVLELGAAEDGEGERLATIDLIRRSYSGRYCAGSPKYVGAHTVGGGDRPGRADGAGRVGIRAISKLVPVVRVGLQVLRLHLDGEVHVIRSESLARVNGFTGELGIVEDLEGNADGNALIRTRWKRLGARPEEDRVIKRIALSPGL